TGELGHYSQLSLAHSRVGCIGSFPFKQQLARRRHGTPFNSSERTPHRLMCQYQWRDRLGSERPGSLPNTPPRTAQRGRTKRHGKSPCRVRTASWLVRLGAALVGPPSP